MNEQYFLDTAHHRCAFSMIDVRLYNRESLEDGETPDVILKIPFRESLEIARYLLAHQTELEARQVELDAQFAQLSKTLLDLFAVEKPSETEAWQGEIVYIPGLPAGLSRPLSEAYRQLKEQYATRVRHWCHEDEEQEKLFWLFFEQFFYEHHRDDLVEKFLPEKEAEKKE
ncbi:MAG TPA: hypothetical protein VFA10_28770 [Ktedonobacteraceae bacterium]|nr:hypothetical protein [Ktedonobacteraceae bacterium]